MQVLEHDSSCCLLLLFVDGEGAAVEPKVGVDFLDEFGKDSALVVVGFAKVVGWAIEECILFSGMAVEVEVHEGSVLAVQFLSELLD